MELFLDSINLEEINELNNFGILDGVTTNPSLLSKVNGDWHIHIKKIAENVKGPVSVEVLTDDYCEIIRQGESIFSIAKNVVLKLPVTLNGIKACKYFAKLKKPVNMTLCFNTIQALIAAKAGATYISPFIGRIDDLYYNGITLIEDIKKVFSNYQLTTKVLVASVRSRTHIYQSLLIGAHSITIPYHLFKQIVANPLTDLGLNKFMQDWIKSGLKI